MQNFSNLWVERFGKFRDSLPVLTVLNTLHMCSNMISVYRTGN